MYSVTREYAGDHSKRERRTVRMYLHINLMYAHVKL